MSIVAPVGKDSAVILDAAQPICNAITASWRAVAEAVQRASINCQVKSDTDFKLDPDGDGGQCEGKTESALQQVKIYPLGKTFMAALKANHDGGTVQLNFTSARQPFDLPAVAVPPVPIPQDPKISLGAKRIVVAEIYRRTGANHCTMRELDVTKLRTAEFSTNGPLSATINMLIGCPAVHLEIRDFISDSPAVPAAHDFLILRVVGLTPDWHFEPRVIDFLYNCVDEIEALMPEEMRRANR